MRFKVKTLSEYVNESRNSKKKPIPGDSINIFDIDDTLIITKAKIKVYDPITKNEYSLTPAEYNDYQRMPHHKLDFSDFDDVEILKNGQLIEWVVDILRKTMAKGKAVGVVTARSANTKVLKEFFNHHNIRIHSDLIIPVNEPGAPYSGNNAERKQQAFEDLIEMGYRKFKFFDDDMNNLKMVKGLEQTHDVKIDVRHIQPKWTPKIKEAYKDRLLETIYDDSMKHWALNAHISDFFVPAKDSKELMSLFNDARKKTSRSPQAWPMSAIKYFYNWHLDRIKDRNRVKKAELLATESKEYYGEISRGSNNISE